jgi:hypothetical protein
VPLVFDPLIYKQTLQETDYTSANLRVPSASILLPAWSENEMNEVTDICYS